MRCSFIARVCRVWIDPTQSNSLEIGPRAFRSHTSVVRDTLEMPCHHWLLGPVEMPPRRGAVIGFADPGFVPVLLCTVFPRLLARS